MHIIPLKTISLISSNVPDSTEQEWTQEATYSMGEKVKVTTTFPHKEYESVLDNNTDNAPGSKIGWKELGATNRLAMFDTYVSSQTQNPDSIVVEIDSGKCNVLSLFRLDAKSVTLETIYKGSVIETQSFNLRATRSRTFSDYAFGAVAYKRAISTSIKIRAFSSVRITISKIGGIAKCGHVGVGRQEFIGKSEWGFDAGITDFSIVDENQWGQIYLDPGDYADTIDFPVEVKTKAISRLKNRLTDLRATPIVVQGNNSDTDHEILIVYGYIRDFRITGKGPVNSKCSLDIRGLT